jgi:hypothetical protein
MKHAIPYVIVRLYKKAEKPKAIELARSASGFPKE